MIERDLRLTEDLRRKLKKPLGKLLKDLSTLDKTGQLICVGDTATRIALELGFRPKLCVYDGKTQRIRIKVPDIVKNFDAREVKVKNPPGVLTRGVFSEIEKSLKRAENTRIIIDGEEDLTALAAILAASDGTFVVYGQPNEGIVVVKVDKKIRDEVKGMISRMEEVE